MLSELTKKGILTIKGLLDECKVGIEQTNKDLEVIDEKYRKLIAEEKKTLKANLSEYKAQLKQYEKMFSTFDATAVKEVLGDFESTVTEITDENTESSSTSEDEGTVFDSVYPENNEPDEKEEEKEPVLVPADSNEPVDAVNPDRTDAPAVKEEAEALKDLGAEEDADWDEKIESGELKEVPTFENNDDGWPAFEDFK